MLHVREDVRVIKHFVEFQGKQTTTGRKEIRVSLNSKKVFVLNPKAYQALGSPDAVKLFFDEGRKIIGMRAATTEQPNAFTLKRCAGRHQMIYAATFCTHFGIRVEGTVKFLNPEMDGDMLTLEITKTVNVTRGAR